MKGIRNIGVCKVNIDTNEVIEEYNSVSIAALKNGIRQNSISNVLTNRAKTSGGYKWQYRHTN
jgi:hypothetical protein